MYPYKHILLATDLSDICGLVTAQAKSMADLYSSKLSIVHAIEPIPAYGYPGFEDLQTPLIDHARQQVEKLAKDSGIPESQIYLEFGAVKKEILRVAKEIKADLIVIGSHGRHGLSRLLGSGANAIVHGAECDVLTVRCQSD